jgi:hypothetical protein
MPHDGSFRWPPFSTVLALILPLLGACALAVWAQMKLTTFVEGFVPNLAATMIAVLVGLPGGLWLNRKALALQDERERATRKDRLRHALGQLLGAGRFNLVLLSHFA